MRTIAFFTLIWFVFAGLCSGQSVVEEHTSDLDDQYVIQQWTVDDGLPINSVNSIVQDDKGYIWLATYDGWIGSFGGGWRCICPQKAER